jgi:hypothetical protein
MALIRQAWPEILAALNSGHTLKRVRGRLNEVGIAVKYKTLSAYIGILRREQAQRSAPALERKPRAAPVLDPVQVPTAPVPTVSRTNPLATAMEYLSKVRGFQNFTGEPPDPDKIF